MNLFLEAVHVERDLALLTQQDSLHVPLALVCTVLTVPPLRLPAVLLRVHDPMIEPIKPGVHVDTGAAVALPGGVLPVLVEHLNHELPEEVQKGLFLARGEHAQAPGLHSADAERPRVERPPPLPLPEPYPLEYFLYSIRRTLNSAKKKIKKEEELECCIKYLQYTVYSKKNNSPVTGNAVVQLVHTPHPPVVVLYHGRDGQLQILLLLVYSLVPTRIQIQILNKNTEYKY